MCQIKTEFGVDVKRIYPEGMSDKVIGKIERMNTKLNKRSEAQDQKKVHRMKDDILAVSTQWTRTVVSYVQKVAQEALNSNAYKVLTRTTQPAHVIAVAVVALVLCVIYPNLTKEPSYDGADADASSRSVWAQIGYLGTFAIHFGTQMWMTFVSGLALYFNLPRHTFGQIQQILFPKYFSLNAILSISTLILFVKVIDSRSWHLATYVQVIALAVCALIELAVRLYLAPPLLQLMRIKHKFETSAGTGQEVGHLNQANLVHCPHYQKIHSAFRRIHMTVAMGNMTTLVCTFLHLYYLAAKIRI